MIRVISKENMVRNHVSRKIWGIMEGDNQYRAAELLAKLRRGAGKGVECCAEAWEITLAGVPDELVGKNGETSCAEVAIHTALTLFALHQQGNNGNNMSCTGISLGTAVKMLINTDKTNVDAVTKRFNTLVSSETFSRLAWYLRGVIQVLKADGIKLDYGELASDLYKFQLNGNKDKVKLSWGKDFYSYKGTEDLESEENENEQEQ